MRIKNSASFFKVPSLLNQDGALSYTRRFQTRNVSLALTRKAKRRCALARGCSIPTLKMYTWLRGLRQRSSRRQSNLKRMKLWDPNSTLVLAVFAITGVLLGAAVIFGSPVRTTAQAPAAQAPPQAQPQSGGPGRPGNRPSRPTRVETRRIAAGPTDWWKARRDRRFSRCPVRDRLQAPAARATGRRDLDRDDRPVDRRHLTHGGPAIAIACAITIGRNFGYINRGRRPIFTIGGFIPFGDRGYFRPVPPGLYGYLPPRRRDM